MAYLLFIAWRYLRNNLLNTLLNALLLAFGVGIIIFLLLVTRQANEKFEKDAKGFSLVVGAKGSPLQLVLCSVYHADFPTGNIPMRVYEELKARKGFVKKAIPLALGDNLQGYRIVGTTHDYPEHYGAKLKEGKWHEKTMEAVAGAEAARVLKLKPGQSFAGGHGLDKESDNKHEDKKYQITGILEATGTVIDRLVLTNIESVWAVHDLEYETPPTATKGDSLTKDSEEEAPDMREITSVLVSYSNTRAALMMPRMIDAQENLKAADVNFELSRLRLLLGGGETLMLYFAYVVIIIAFLSIFIALYNALKEREYDLALMRTLGASKNKLFFQILSEGLLLALIGGLVGIALGHLAVEISGGHLEDNLQFSFTGRVWLREEWYVLAGVSTIGLLAALLPAASVYRLDISKTLAK